MPIVEVLSGLGDEGGPNIINDLTPYQVGMKDPTNKKLVYSGATVTPDTLGWVFDATLEVPSGSLKLSDVSSISEATTEVFFHEFLLGESAVSINSTIGTGGTSQPFLQAANDEREVETQDVFNTLITTNPLILPALTTSGDLQTNAFTLKVDSPMTNVRFTLTDNATGLILKYLPSKKAVEEGVGGYDWVAGEVTIDLNSSDPDGVNDFHAGFTPLRSLNNRVGVFKIEADNVALLGLGGVVPYIRNKIQGLKKIEVPILPDTSNISDKYTRLNNEYSSVTATAGGVVVNYQSTGVSDTVTSGRFRDENDGADALTIITDGSNTFSQGAIIQIADTHLNDGFFEVDSHVGNVLTIRGPTTTTTVEGFTRDNLLDFIDSAVITQIHVSVLRSGVDGRWEQGSGSTTGIEFTAIYDDITQVSKLEAYLSTDLTLDTTLEEKIIEFDTVSSSNDISLGLNGEIEVLKSGQYAGHLVLYINETSNPTVVVWNEVKPLATGVWELSGGMAKTKIAEDSVFTLSLDGSMALQAGDKVRIKTMLIGQGADKFVLEGISQAVTLGTISQPSANIEIIRQGAL